MSGEEVCIVIIPNDFLNNNEDDKNANDHNKHVESQVGFDTHFFFRKNHWTFL
jgi:hypothetical protein